MDMHSREQYLESLRAEYRRADKRQTTRLLNEARNARISFRSYPLADGRAGHFSAAARLQNQYGITDSADQVYLDHTNHRNKEYRFGDRELIRAWADENAATFDFLLDNGVIFDEKPPTIENGGTVPRLFVTKPYSDNLNETINGSPGSGRGHWGQRFPLLSLFDRNDHRARRRAARRHH
jgi:hypothetical protein